jgi:ubiquinone/menaquinone biosynthesis C-methylase UbiE
VTRQQRQIVERFTARYAEPMAEADLAVEREVFGVTDQGINGYTTLHQADALADRLALRSGMRLLDIGAGRGWPGLHLAGTTGCHVVLCDLPLAALRDGLKRAHRHHVQERSSFLLGSGAALPFHPGAFDAVVHTDVL